MILAIDPGGTTGMAYLTRPGTFDTVQVPDGAAGMWPVLSRVFYDGDDETEKWMPWQPLDAVVIENYVPRPGAKSQQLDAVHIIGAVKYLCHVHRVPLYIQTPAQAKSFSTNDKLKAAGWYSVGEDHGRDAARHLLVWLCMQRGESLYYSRHRDAVLARLVETQ